ncbi:MAG TPA: RsmE family RNA methyltransferase, partial [Abditibacteriaceae bacterium]|nr:RsmE family RNA methyltransferase [Abditibacteriaceae bacterium]
AIADFATAVDYGTHDSRCFMLDERREIESLRAALARAPLLPPAAPETALGTLADGAELPRLMLLIGPEGGWTEHERAWADRYGVEAVSLGNRILRTETAALVAAAILQWEAGDLG